MPTWRCRLGIHTAQRSQGVVGYCLRGCGLPKVPRRRADMVNLYEKRR